MSGFLQSRMDYIFFVYGLSFILMAAQCLALRARSRSLPWGLLAVFGIIHGISQWLDMLALSLSDSPAFLGARVLVKAVAFVALIEFGRRGLSRDGRPILGRWLTPTLIGLAALGALSGNMNGINAACRYALGFPGALMAAAVLWRISTACAGSQRSGLRLASLSMLVYGLATGLVVPNAAFVPAVWLNNDVFLATAGFPVQLVRMFCAFAAMAGFWLRGRHGESSNEEIGVVRRWSFPTVLVLLLALGWFAADSRGKTTDADMRHQLLGQAVKIADTIDPQLVKALSFTAADRDNPAFQRLREEMIAYHRDTQTLGIHSISLRGGKIVFGPESYPIGDPVASPPGTVFERFAPEELGIFQSREPFAIGPVTNEYGSFVTTYAPVRDSLTGEVLMAVGMAIEADDWKAHVAAARLLPIIGALALIIIVLGGMGAIHWRNALIPDKQIRFRHLDTALAAAVGLALTVMFSLPTLESDNREREKIFQETVQTHVEKANDAFRAISSDVAALGRFIQTDEQVTRRQFHDYVDPLIETCATQWYGWIQRVPAAQRAGVEPLQGFDEGSEPTRRAALEEAIRTGLPTATDSVTVINETGGPGALLVFHPVFAKQDSAGGERRFRGFALGMVRYQTLLDRATGGDADAASMVKTHLVDLMSAGGPRVLASTSTKMECDLYKTFDRSYLERQTFYNTSPIFAFGRAYAVVSHPTPAFFAAYPARGHMVTGAAGLLITAMLSLLAGFIRNRQTFLERAVRERTAELRKSEENLSTTLNSIGDAVISTDVQGRVVRMNPVAEELTGWTLSEGIGRPISEVLNIVNALTHEPAPIPVHEVLSTGEVCHLSNHTTLISRDGTERQIADSAAPIRDDSGAVTGVVLVFSDVSEQYRVREELRESEEQYRVIFQGSAHGILMTDTETKRFMYANPAICRMLGYTESELLQLGVADIHTKESLDQLQSEMESIALGERTIANAVLPCLRKDGTVFYAEVTPAVTKRGGRTCNVGFFTDITERKQAEKRLARINECLLTLGPDFEENINQLTSLCGELLGATCALYNRLDGGMLCSVGRWSTPPDFDPVDRPDGHICYDVIKQGGNDTFIVRNLPDSVYWTSDPNVAKYGLKTYFGQAVKCGDACVGSLCTVFQDDFEPTEDEKRIMGIIASAVSTEEQRKQAEEALRESEEHYRGLFEHMAEGYAYCRMIFENGEPQDFIYLGVNAAFETLTGLRNVTGKRVSEVIPGIREADPELFAIYSRVSLTGKPEKFEVFVEALNMWFSISVYSPEAGCFAALFDVITERKLLSEQLDAAATQVKGLMSQVVTGDRFTARFENPSLSRCWEEKKCTKTDCPSYGNLGNLRCWEVAGTFCEGKTQGTFALKYGDCSLCEVYRAARANPVMELGETFNTMMAILDERRAALVQAKDALKSQSDNLSAIFASSPVGMLLLDEETMIVDANAVIGSMISRSPEEIISQRGGGGLGCAHSSENEKGCGFSSVCPDCALRQALIQVLADGTSIRGAEIQMTLMIDGQEHRPWLRVSAEPVLVNGRKHVIVAIDDVTEQKQAEAEIQKQKERLTVILAGIGDGVIAVGADSRITAMNPAAQKLLSLKEEDAIGQPFLDVFRPVNSTTGEMADDPIASVLSDDRTGGLPRDTVVETVDGRRMFVSATFSRIKEASGDASGAVVAFRDVTSHRKNEEALSAAMAEIEKTNANLEEALLSANEFAVQAEVARAETEEKAVELSHQAAHDALTGLPNRQYFEQHLSERITGCAGKKSRSFTMLFLDLDKFKLINDTLGHKVGDLLLVEVADRLQSCIRSEDLLARMGGDEFTVLLPRCQRQSLADSVASRVIDSISRPFEIQGHRFVIGASIGLASYPSDGADAVTLLKHADAAMYKAKQAGRGTFRWYSGEVDVENQQRADMDMDIRSALDTGQLEVYYQPIVSLDDGNILAAEALLRWDHPEKGMISPSLFIPIAEEIGMIVPIGDYVLRAACAQTVAWQDEGIHLSQIAVNISTAQVHDAGWLDSVSAALSDAGLDARCLNLEVTETDFAADYESMKETLRKAQELGIRMAIDDFGMGQSSLSRLKDFPVIHLKIDGSFVRDIEHNKNDNALVRSIIEMAHGQGIKVTAEWVETGAQMEILRSIGCDYAQGYFISPALPAAAFVDFVRDWTFAQRQADAA